jgi:hypothetical protein
MATILPSDLTTLHLSRGETAELRTLDLLRRSLPAGTRFSTPCTGPYRPRTAPFSVRRTFIVVNRSGEAVVVEQKAGSLVESESGLGKIYEGSAPKLVAPQIHRNS